MSGAIAAGNCVVVKPSELAPKTASVIAKLMAKYMDPDCFAVVLGGIPETTELLSLKFDYIFYTGGAKVKAILNLKQICFLQSHIIPFLHYLIL
jgi:acyl-CoA reductase-like NAD-dependent aldehyde dehydrogenase